MSKGSPSRSTRGRCPCPASSPLPQMFSALDASQNHLGMVPRHYTFVKKENKKPFVRARWTESQGLGVTFFFSFFFLTAPRWFYCAAGLRTTYLDSTHGCYPTLSLLPSFQTHPRRFLRLFSHQRFLGARKLSPAAEGIQFRLGREDDWKERWYWGMEEAGLAGHPASSPRRQHTACAHKATTTPEGLIPLGLGGDTLSTVMLSFFFAGMGEGTN